MKDLKLKSGGTVEIKNTKLRGIRFGVHLLKNPAYTPSLSAGPLGFQEDSIPRFLADKVNVTATLKRNKQSWVLFSQDLRTLHCGTNIETPLFELGRYLDKYEVMDKTGGTALIPLSINFGSCIDLKGDDKLEIVFNSSYECMPGSVVTTAPFVTPTYGSAINIITAQTGTPFVNTEDSFVRIAPIIADELEQEGRTPYIKTQWVEANAPSWSEQIGDNCTEIVVMNFKLPRLTIAGNQMMREISCLTGATLNSDGKDVTFQEADFLDTRMRANDTSVATALRRNTFVIYKDASDPLDEVKLNLQFNTSMIDSRNTVILYRTFYTDPHLWTKATVAVQESHAKRNNKNFSLASVRKQLVKNPAIKKFFAH